MKGLVKITIGMEANIESGNFEVQSRLEAMVECSRERIEAAIAEAVCRELRSLLPGISAECVEIGWEGEG